MGHIKKHIHENSRTTPTEFTDSIADPVFDIHQGHGVSQADRKL